MLSFRLSSHLLTLLPVIGIFIIVTEDNSLYDPPLSSSDIQCIMYMFLCFEQSVQLSCVHVPIFNFQFSSKKSTAVCKKKKKKWKFCPQFIFHHLLSLPRYHNLNYIVIGLTMYRNFILYSLWTHDKHFLVWIYNIVKSLTCLCMIGRNSLVSCMQNVRRTCMFYFSSALQLYTL